MKVKSKYYIILAFLMISSHSANALTPSGIMTNSSAKHELSFDVDMRTCYEKLNMLKRYDFNKNKKINKLLMDVIQSQASVSASEQYISHEALAYIRAQQKKTIFKLCLQSALLLDGYMVKKSIVSSDL